MSRQPVSNQNSSILDDVGGFFSKLWHGVTSFFSNLFGGSDKSNSSTTANSASASDDDPQSDNSTQPTSRQTNGRHHHRRQEFDRAANNNGWAGAGNRDISYASATEGSCFRHVDRASSRFNVNAFGGRESFVPDFAGNGGGMGFHHGGGMGGGCHMGHHR